MKHRKIGVFDSGIGGQSVANAIAKAYPELDVQFRSDPEHLPYGTKPPQEILGYVMPILSELVESGCEALVVACNTVSTTLITDLRAAFTVPIIGVEPMVKPAAEQTKTGVIGVCATPTTLASARYASLKEQFAKGMTIIEPDCSHWTQMIETNQIDHDSIDQNVDQMLAAGADIIVLACTHYHWIEDEIKKRADGRATVLQPEAAIVRQVATVLELQP